MIETITLDALTQDGVSIKTQKNILQDGVTYEIDQPHRCAYVNSARGRQQLLQNVPEPYRGAVLAVWGDAPTVQEPMEGGETI